MELTFSQVLNVLLLTAVICLIREVYKVFTFVNDCLSAYEAKYIEIRIKQNDFLIKCDEILVKLNALKDELSKQQS